MTNVKNIVVLALGLVLLLAGGVSYAQPQSHPPARDQEKQKKGRQPVRSGTPDPEPATNPTAVSDERESSPSFKSSAPDPTEVRVSRLQEKADRLEKELNDLDMRLPKIAAVPSGRVKFGNPVPVWGLLAIGLGITALGIAIGGCVWMKVSAEKGVRKALREAGLL